MTDLAPRQPDAAPAVYDAATLAVLAAMDCGDSSRTKKAQRALEKREWRRDAARYSGRTA